MTVGTACDVARGGFADVRSRQGTVYVVAVDAARVAAKRSACANAVTEWRMSRSRSSTLPNSRERKRDSVRAREEARHVQLRYAPAPAPTASLWLPPSLTAARGASARTSPVREAPPVIGTETGGVCGRGGAWTPPRVALSRFADLERWSSGARARTLQQPALEQQPTRDGRCMQMWARAGRAVFANAGPSVLVQPSRQSARQKKCQYLYMELDGSMNVFGASLGRKVEEGSGGGEDQPEGAGVRGQVSAGGRHTVRTARGTGQATALGDGEDCAGDEEDRGARGSRARAAGAVFARHTAPGVVADAVHFALALAIRAAPPPLDAIRAAGSSWSRPPHVRRPLQSWPAPAPAPAPRPPSMANVPTRMRRNSDTITLPIAPGAGAGVGYQHPSRACGVYTYLPPYAPGLGPGPAPQYSGAARVQA
ncbi:hypothetical protein GGX14DRAFT_561891 [Mycena pura]|uniref:Uncharacterized protein n=1 Tax=Mycena pura TaxID=153505 RepID=A0AAD6VUB5_9AGAR|nr:hypothetical protein GGX14DRAFT_561891 [Mycena pura]